jgi:hypothetical protein
MPDPIDKELADLVQKIDENPDRLHADVTPAVLQLMDLGLPGAKAVLELLDAPEWLTRIRVQRVIEGVVMRRNGWQPGQGYPEPHEGQEKVATVLASNGSYNAKAPSEHRREAIAKWRQWIEAEEKADRRGVPQHD